MSLRETDPIRADHLLDELIAELDALSERDRFGRECARTLAASATYDDGQPKTPVTKCPRKWGLR